MDYQLLENKATKYFSNLSLSPKRELDSKMQSRIGFYYLSISMLTGLKDFSEITKTIIDQEFVDLYMNKKNNDYGIDAVFIDQDNSIINLFSFKYRDSYSKNSTFGINEITLANKFFDLIDDPKSIPNEDAPLSKQYVKEIDNLLQDFSVDWKIKFYAVSNDGDTLETTKPELLKFRNRYNNLSLNIISLNEFSSMFTIRPKENKATIVLDKNAFLTYEESQLTTSKSYIATLPLVELIKITSQDTDMRKVPIITAEEQYKFLNLDRGVLFDNVRGYLGESEYNLNIMNTLKDEPEKFFLFNNGITITADQIEVVPQNLDKQFKITLNNYQIVNGGQTLRTIYNYKDSENKTSNLVRANVLVRFFKTGSEDGLINKISEYTNSQNAISPIDLKSVDAIQIALERNLSEHGIGYLRKREIDPTERIHETYISMEKVGQLLLAYRGHPEKVSNQKKRIFSDYYKKIFNQSSSLESDVVNLTNQYMLIENMYNATDYQKYEQKIFYIIFLSNYTLDHSVSIQILENSISEFRRDEDVPQSRKLIQTKFKELVIRKLSQSYPNAEIDILKL